MFVCVVQNSFIASIKVKIVLSLCICVHKAYMPSRVPSSWSSSSIDDDHDHDDNQIKVEKNKIKSETSDQLIDNCSRCHGQKRKEKKKRISWRICFAWIGIYIVSTPIHTDRWKWLLAHYGVWSCSCINIETIVHTSYECFIFILEQK